ncbi:hypothetical protein ACHAO9_001061 [Fusarium lateritium]
MSVINETYYPALMQIIEQDPSAADRLGLQCPICMELMNISTEQGQPIRDDHTAYVLPCKHIVGLSCGVTLIAHGLGAGNTLSCPSCRADLFYRGCRHPNIKGTLINLHEDWRARMNDSIEESSRIDEFCAGCYVDFMTHRLTTIAFDEIDFSTILVGRRLLQLSYKWGEKVFVPPSAPRDAPVFMEVAMLPSMANACERVREYLAKLLGVPADKAAEIEFHWKVLQIQEDPDGVLDIQDLLKVRNQAEYLLFTTTVLRVTPDLTRETIARDNMLDLCRLLTFQQEIDDRVRDSMVRVPN